MRNTTEPSPVTEPLPASMQQAPVLVYGTLRTGQPNARLLAGKGRVLGTTRVRGVRMFDNGGFPYAVRTDSQRHSIVCEVFQVWDEKWRETLSSLDMLEGFWGHGVPENHYARVATGWSLPDDPRYRHESWGWLYIASEETEREIAARRLPVVPRGDWLARSR